MTRKALVKVFPIVRHRPYGVEPFEVPLEAGEHVVGAETVPAGVVFFIAKEVEVTDADTADH